MKIRILAGTDCAGRAEGLAVCIDLFRATSTACYVAANGADSIIPLAGLQEAYRLKEKHPGFVLMGERQLRPAPGFDFGNSPAEIENVDFSGRTVIHTTTCGTKGIVRAAGDEVITASFVNCTAVVEYIRRAAPACVSLLALGDPLPGCDVHEDAICAEYISACLQGIPADFASVEELLRKHPSAEKFLNSRFAWTPARDLDLCLALDRFDFVLRREKTEQEYFALKRL